MTATTEATPVRYPFPAPDLSEAGLAKTAVAALGNPGLTRHNALERHLRNALCVRVHPPQEDAALLAAGKRVLGVTP